MSVGVPVGVGIGIAVGKGEVGLALGAAVGEGVGVSLGARVGIGLGEGVGENVPIEIASTVTDDKAELFIAAAMAAIDETRAPEECAALMAVVTVPKTLESVSSSLPALVVALATIISIEIDTALDASSRRSLNRRESSQLWLLKLAFPWI